MTSPYKPDAETLSKTPIEKRVSSTVPPPPPGTVAELRLEIVGCAPYVGSGLTLDRNDQLVVEGPGGQMSDAGASAHVPLVTRPSVSPLPSPATTPSRSRAATPVGIKRTESMSTVVAEEEEEDSMQVDDSATREDETRMQIDGAQRIDPTLDILARNLKEVQNLEEERKRIEAELAQEKALKDKEEERRKREEEEAEEKKRAAEEAEKAERERVKRELEEARLKAEGEGED
ncbi:hypothetical protein FA13DRAFT_206304 [Coprinellus micaceus]|uniref:F5/8 type C domain-containing protein n=1 Tax=Coprinellus micaceus TaxID=71717 RepID=A0A4Y7SG21_COPMI|nr:hypothetical protein FA13DRAFT_206304 [Coprinellus micaceus]